MDSKRGMVLTISHCSITRKKGKGGTKLARATYLLLTRNLEGQKKNGERREGRERALERLDISGEIICS